MGIKKIKQSLLEFKEVRNLCIMAALIAMMMVVRMVSTIKLSSFLEIRFDFLVFLIAGSMFGPVFSVFFGFVADVLPFYFLGSAANFHWGFTLSSIINVLIYGVFLYKYKFDPIRVILVQILNNVLIGFFMNTYWLSSICFGGSFMKAFFMRLPKECMTLPINCLLAVDLVVVFKRVVVGLKLDSLN